MLTFVIFNVNDHKNSFKVLFRALFIHRHFHLSPSSSSSASYLTIQKFMTKKEKLPFEIKSGRKWCFVLHTPLRWKWKNSLIISLYLTKKKRFLHKIRLLIIICLFGHTKTGTKINGWEIMVTSLRTERWTHRRMLTSHARSLIPLRVKIISFEWYLMFQMQWDWFSFIFNDERPIVSSLEHHWTN